MNTRTRITWLVYVFIIASALLVIASPEAQAHKVTRTSCDRVASLYGAARAKMIRTTCYTKTRAHKKQHYCNRLDLRPYPAIVCAFPRSQRATAWRVARCESTADAGRAMSRRYSKGRWAQNGQYLGLFQIGTAERAAHGRYTIGAPAIVQARTARSLQRSRGWQPWACA